MQPDPLQDLRHLSRRFATPQSVDGRWITVGEEYIFEDGVLREQGQILMDESESGPGGPIGSEYGNHSAVAKVNLSAGSRCHDTRKDLDEG
jgi:hypothetical protein